MAIAQKKINGNWTPINSIANKYKRSTNINNSIKIDENKRIKTENLDAYSYDNKKLKDLIENPNYIIEWENKELNIPKSIRNATKFNGKLQQELIQDKSYNVEYYDDKITIKRIYQNPKTYIKEEKNYSGKDDKKETSTYIPHEILFNKNGIPEKEIKREDFENYERRYSGDSRLKSIERRNVYDKEINLFDNKGITIKTQKYDTYKDEVKDYSTGDKKKEYNTFLKEELDYTNQKQLKNNTPKTDYKYKAVSGSLGYVQDTFKIGGKVYTGIKDKATGEFIPDGKQFDKNTTYERFKQDYNAIKNLKGENYIIRDPETQNLIISPNKEWIMNKSNAIINNINVKNRKEFEIESLKEGYNFNSINGDVYKIQNTLKNKNGTQINSFINNLSNNNLQSKQLWALSEGNRTNNNIFNNSNNINYNSKQIRKNQNTEKKNQSINYEEEPWYKAGDFIWDWGTSVAKGGKKLFYDQAKDKISDLYEVGKYVFSKDGKLRDLKYGNIINTEKGMQSLKDRDIQNFAITGTTIAGGGALIKGVSKLKYGTPIIKTAIGGLGAYIGGKTILNPNAKNVGESILFFTPMVANKVNKVGGTLYNTFKLKGKTYIEPVEFIDPINLQTGKHPIVKTTNEAKINLAKANNKVVHTTGNQFKDDLIYIGDSSRSIKGFEDAGVYTASKGRGNKNWLDIQKSKNIEYDYTLNPKKWFESYAKEWKTPTIAEIQTKGVIDKPNQLFTSQKGFSHVNDWNTQNVVGTGYVTTTKRGKLGKGELPKENIKGGTGTPEEEFLIPKGEILKNEGVIGKTKIDGKYVAIQKLSINENPNINIKNLPKNTKASNIYDYYNSKYYYNPNIKYINPLELSPYIAKINTKTSNYNKSYENKKTSNNNYKITPIEKSNYTLKTYDKKEIIKTNYKLKPFNYKKGINIDYIKKDWNTYYNEPEYPIEEKLNNEVYYFNYNKKNQKEYVKKRIPRFDTKRKKSKRNNVVNNNNLALKRFNDPYKSFLGKNKYSNWMNIYFKNRYGTSYV